MRMQVLVPAAALILMSAVGGCSADSSDNASKTTETSASTTPPTTTLPPPPQPPKLVWAPCVVGPGTECADLTVPIDYAEPDGETISIAVTRIPADPTAERIGTLVVNPGGPGVPSRYLAPVLKMGADAVPAEAAVLDRFDIVSFDPRGVGESNPVDCGDTSALDLADYSPESPAEMANLKATMKAFAAACEENTGPLLQHMSTIETARDVEQMRRALGEDKLNLLGFSYGTELFGTYADLFPERVRTAVLDGVIPSEITGVEVYGRQAASVERHFQRFLDACDAAPDCPIPGDDAGTFYDELIKTWDTRAPVVAGASGPTASELATVAATAVFEPTFPTSFAQGLADAAAGDASEIESEWDFYAGTTKGASPSLVSGIAINCATWSWPSADEMFDQAVTDQENSSPRMGEAFLREYLPCAYWGPPSEPTGLRTATGAPTIVVVGTTNDPATPYASSEQVVDELDDAVLVTRQGDGHVAWSASSCIRREVGRYLVTATPPKAGITCPSDP